MHRLIPLGRLRQIATETLAARFGWIEKTPPKARELREKPAARVAGREHDVLGGLPAGKFARHLRRNAKLRLFRLWKLVQEPQKRALADDGPLRPLAERLRAIGWMRRL